MEVYFLRTWNCNYISGDIEMKTDELHDTTLWMNESQKILADSKTNDPMEQMRLYRYFNKLRLQEEDNILIASHHKNIKALARQTMIKAVE